VVAFADACRIRDMVATKSNVDPTMPSRKNVFFHILSILSVYLASGLLGAFAVLCLRNVYAGPYILVIILIALIAAAGKVFVAIERGYK
jgi:hypothetical protein